MSNDILTYKGYSTRVLYSVEDRILYGKIEGIADLINFESDTPDGVEAAFHEAVDDYLAFCEEIGQEPDKEYKGTFNVRIDPKLHKEIDRAAHAEGISMNQYIANALTRYVEKTKDDTPTIRYTDPDKNKDLSNTIISLWNSSDDSHMKKISHILTGQTPFMAYKS